MKIPKKRVIYSNYYNEELYEEIKNNLVELNEGIIPSENEIWDEYNFSQSMDFEFFEDAFNEFINNDTFVLQGSIGLYHGTYQGGFIFDTFNELCRAWKDSDYIEIYDENGHLYLKCSHHDGTNFYEIRKLNHKGYEYYSKHYDDDKRKLHTRLMNKPYSVLPNYVHKVWGGKLREYE